MHLVWIRPGLACSTQRIQTSRAFIQFIRIYTARTLRLVVCLLLWNVSLQERKVLLGRLAALLAFHDCGALSGCSAERWLLRVEFGQFASEIGG
jgi:hypothetical protein